MRPLFLEECSACLALEERVFTDSWTGMSLCNSCLYEIIGDVTNSPCSEKDNLKKLLIDHDLFEDDEDLKEHNYSSDANEHNYSSDANEHNYSSDANEHNHLSDANG